jgi:hypothetical protein
VEASVAKPIDAVVAKVDPYDPSAGFLVPFVVQRVLDSAKSQSPETSSEAVAKAVMTRLYQGDPTQLVLALVNDKSQVVGHAVAQLGMDQSSCWATVLQIKADPGVGNGQKTAMEAIQTWAQKNGATKLVLITGKGDKGWEDEFGFKLYRQIKVCDIDL